MGRGVFLLVTIIVCILGRPGTCIKLPSAFLTHFVTTTTNPPDASLKTPQLFVVKDTTAVESTKDNNDGFKIPPWKDIAEVPISVDSKEHFDAIPLPKRIAIISRVSVLHLTLLSCFGPLIIRGAVRSALPAAARVGMAVNPVFALLFTIDCLSWHVFHNLLNDLQDLDDDDSVPDSYRLAYGCHALKQGFLTKPQFLRIMGLVSIPGVVLSVAFAKTVLAPATIFGLGALYLYTILFKPLALGELLIYLVWGPVMGGFGSVAAGAPYRGVTSLLVDPAVALFGFSALALIMGKHTDKITRSKKLTLPKLLGYPAALYACAFTILAPHVVLLWTLLRDYVGWSWAWNAAGGGAPGTTTPSLPLGAALAFLTLFREVPATLRILRMGPAPRQNPFPPGTRLKGTIADAEVDRTWPLWFVAYTGWHAITFSYLLVVGSGLEWAVRAILHRF